MAHNKFDSVLILGENAISPNDKVPLITALNFAIIGDGIRAISRNEIFTSLYGKININTRIYINAHGIMANHVHHMILFENEFETPTKHLFSILANFTSNPIEIVILSCFGGGALKDIDPLPIGSIVISLSTEHDVVRNTISKYVLEESLLNRNSQPRVPLLKEISSKFHEFMQQGLSIAIKLNNNKIEIFSISAPAELISDRHAIEIYYKNKWFGEIRNRLQDLQNHDLLPTNINIDDISEHSYSFTEQQREELQTANAIHLFDTALINANQTLSQQIIDNVINGNINTNPANSLLLANLVKYANINNLKKLIKSPETANSIIANKTPLMLAAEVGNIENIKYLLSLGADINFVHSKSCALLTSLTTGNLETTIDLIRNGANPHIENCDFMSKATESGLEEFVNHFTPSEPTIIGGINSQEY